MVNVPAVPLTEALPDFAINLYVPAARADEVVTVMPRLLRLKLPEPPTVMGAVEPPP